MAKLRILTINESKTQPQSKSNLAEILHGFINSIKLNYIFKANRKSILAKFFSVAPKELLSLHLEGLKIVLSN